MNKYYIPNIEEFHVGFEMEVGNKTANSTEFGSYIFETDEDLFYNGFKDPLEKRVKYLDKEDIESFGFNTKLFPTTTIRGLKFINREMLEDGEWCEGQVIISVRKFLADTKWPHVSIRKYDINDPNKIYTFLELEIVRKEYLFQGVIKNKSELKKLLKQLEINE